MQKKLNNQYVNKWKKEKKRKERQPIITIQYTNTEYQRCQCWLDFEWQNVYQWDFEKLMRNFKS